MSTRIRTLFGSVVFLLGLFFHQTSPVPAATTYNMATTTNWNLRIDGAVAGQSQFGLGQEGGTRWGDLNNNGIPDLILSSVFADNNSRTDSGSVYVIFDNLLQATGTGNIVDLATTTNWNIRYDGSAADERLGTDYVEIADVNSDGKNDIIIGAKRADKNSRTDSGSVYVIYNSLINDYSGTGNTVDLITSTNYNLRYDGSTASILMSDEGILAHDINANGKPDLVFATSVADFNSRNDSGSAYIILDSLIDDYSGTGNNIDLNTSTNYNIRYDGAAASDSLSSTGVYSADIDNDGNNDLLISSWLTDFGATNAGSAYVVNSDLIAATSGTGNNVDFGITSNWNIRIDGRATSSFFTGLNNRNIFYGDIDNDGFDDLVVSASVEYINFAGSGSVYIFRNSALSGLSGTGNTVSLSSSSNFGIRLNGGATQATVSRTGLEFFDFNGDGRNDISLSSTASSNSNVHVVYSSLLDSYTGSGNDVTVTNAANHNILYYFTGTTNTLGQPLSAADVNHDGKTEPIFICNRCDFNSRTDSGSVYIAYNFPHTITLNSFAARPNETFTVTGTVTATNSVTNISGVQYAADSNSPTGAWSNCSASDGGFDGYTEAFTCSIFPISAANHTLYFRSYDANTSYTAQANYGSSTFDLTAGTSPVNTSNGNTTAPAPAVESGAGGTISGGTDSSVIIEEGAVPFASNLSSTSISSHDTPVGIRTASCGVGDIHQIWLTDYYNKANILASVQNKPSIIALHYNDFQLLKTGGGSVPESSLKISYSPDGITWTTLPTSVVDQVNNTVAALHKIGGHYMITSCGGRTGSRLLGTSISVGKSLGVTDDKSESDETLDISIIRTTTPETFVAPQTGTPKLNNDTKAGILDRSIDFLRRFLQQLFR